MNKKMKGLVKDTLIFAVGNFGSKVILFLLVPLYTNYLSTSEYGSAEFIFTMSQLLYPIVSLCIYEGVIRIGLKKTVKEENTLVCAFAVWGVSCIILALTTNLWTFYSPVSSWRWYLSFYTALHILCEIELDYLKVKGKNKLFAISCIIQTFILALLNLYLLAYEHAGVRGYLLANTIALLVEAIFIFIVGKFTLELKKGTFDFQILKLMLWYSVPLILNNISWWVIHSSDKIMIEAMLTTAELGLYTVATKIPSLINVFINIFSQSWGISSIREMESENDSNFYSSVFVLYSTLVIGCAIIVIAVTKPFMTIYVGTDFTDSWQFVPLLIVSAVFSSLAAYFASLMGALQISKITMKTTLAGAIVNIVFNYVFIKIVGIWGAIIGTLCAYIVIAFSRGIATMRRLDVDIPKKATIINLVTVFIQAVFVSANKGVLFVSTIAIVIFIMTNKNAIFILFNNIKHIIIRKN